MARPAVVTGANRGIGKEVARQLQAAGLAVIATARSEEAARQTAHELGTQHAALDVTSDASVEALRAFLPDSGLDVLVNNAGVALDGFNRNVAVTTLETNFFGVRRVTEALLPLMSEAARIVMVSSGAGGLENVREPLRGRLARLEITELELLELMREFPEEVAAGTHERHGWPSSAYKVSKAGLNAYCRLLNARLRTDDRRILLNAVCPGWVHTDMGGRHAPRSPEQGAQSVVWAALLPPDGPSGGFFRDGHAIDW